MKILVVDRFPITFLDNLSQRGLEITYIPHSSREEILKIIPNHHILIINSKVMVDEELIEKAVDLKMVLRAGVGMDHIRVDLLEKKGIRVHNAKGGNADAVGEHMVGMLLSLRNNLVRADREVRNFEWNREPNRGIEIGKKTVGIIGYGFTGKSVAKKLSGFDCRILAYDKYLRDYSDQYVEESDLDRIYREAEIVSFHVPLTEETRNWVNKDFMNKFYQPIWLLNLARGPIVKIDDLLWGLDRGKVVAAALDVLPNEKMHLLSENERSLYEDLFARENVLLSPHIGGWTKESLRNINGMLLDYVDDLIQNYS